MRQTDMTEQSTIHCLIWSDEYSVGIEEIDAQHKELIVRFAQVQQAIANRQGWSELHFAILGILRYADFHFQFEEALMRMYGYPKLADHIQEHRHILRAAETMIDESLREIALDDVAQFYQSWLATHIQEADRPYAEFILAGHPVVKPAVPSPRPS